MRSDLEYALNTHFNAMETLQTYDQVRRFISGKLQEKSIGDLDFYSLRELFQIAQPFTKLKVDDSFSLLLADVDQSAIQKSVNNKTGLEIANHVWLQQLMLKTEKRILPINSKFHFWKKKYGVVVSLAGKPVIRFESMTHYNHVYVYGTVVIYNVTSLDEFKASLPSIIIENDYKITLRPKQQRGCIRNVTAAMFIKITRHLFDENTVKNDN